MWSKVWDIAKSLSGKFEVSLAIADSDQKVLESSFRFVTEHVSVLFSRKIIKIITPENLFAFKSVMINPKEVK